MSGGDLPQSSVHEVCYGNCPRIWPVGSAASDPAEEKLEEEKKIPDEYKTEIGRKILKISLDPCYVMVKLTRPECRSLRNFIISNSSKLEVIDGTFCGISTKVFNVNNNTMEGNSAVGLLKFKTTDQAYRFVMSEPRMNRQEFLGGSYDVWTVSLCAQDRSVEPNPANPDKMVNSMNVFHFVHIKKVAALTEDVTSLSAEARSEAQKTADRDKKAVEEALQTVQRYDGRLVVSTDRLNRIRGLPLTNAEGEPQKYLYMTQWRGVHDFWRWFDSEEGRRFLVAIKDYTGGDYQSLVFTCCLDFHDLI